MEPIKEVRKRDGKIALFQKEKIAEAIFKAAAAVGGADRSLADDLADAVNIYLTREFIGSVPTVEEIQDIVEKVLIKTGHAKTAKAYIIYRQKRAKVRQVRAGLLPEETKLAAAEAIKIRESTDLALFVRTSQEDIVSWDREKIVEALCRETGISRNIADIIALEIEEEIVASRTQTLTAPLIREMVNAKLVEYGYEEERRRHTRLGLPLYDVRQLITLPNKENANIPHNPEATNLSLSEAIKKEFALLEVFSQDVSDSHLSGDIHLHDLGMIDRPYSFYGDECVYLKASDGIKNISFAQLFSQSDVIYQENGFEIGTKTGCFVYDRNGWMSLVRVVRHKKESKKMLRVKTEDSKSVIVTLDHPMLLVDDLLTLTPAGKLKVGDRLLVLEKFKVDAPIGKGGEIVSIKEIPINDEFVYDITTESGTFYCNGILVHNCSGQSLEYVKKYGLSLPNALNIAKPAKHPETLLAHMVKFSAALQGHFAGAIGWDAVNYFFAPFLVGMSDKDIKQLAQMMIYEYSQQAVARGGQAIFSDINIYWEVPDHFVKTPAIGPGGQYTGKTYNDYQKEAQKFAWALFEVYLEGDGLGRPFFFPKPLCHLTNKLFATAGAEDYLTLISRVAAEKGNTYFVFDRGKTAKISECCRLSFILDSQDLSEAVTPWKMRFCALQNVTLNLPRAAYLAKGSEERLFTELDRMLSLAVKAHQQKRVFINRLLALGDKSPLALLTMKQDGENYLRMHRVTYLVGLIGLNELVQSHLGQELHESEAALRFGLKVIAHLNLACQRYSKELGMKFVLEQTPAESTAYRLAKLDLAHFPLQAHKVVKGTPDSGGAYYTNSTYYNVSIPFSPVEKVKMEGLFHPLIEAGALTHVWLGESNPDPLALASFVKKTFLHTQNAQIAFSPEFTACLDCGKVIRGLKEQCSYCKEAV